MLFNRVDKVHLFTMPVDMRKSIDGLSYLLCDLGEHDFQDGSVTIFYNRSRDKVKLLYWDKNGFVLVYKRLERGRFKMKPDKNSKTVMLDAKQLSWLLAGLEYELMKQFESLDFSEYF